MSTAEAVQAKHWTARLVQLESRGPGDTDNALRRIARRYGLTYGALWSLRYRSPKRVWADVYTKLRAAYDAERERQARALLHDLEITKAVAGSDHAAVVKAEALVGPASPHAAEAQLRARLAAQPQAMTEDP